MPTSEASAQDIQSYNEIVRSLEETPVQKMEPRKLSSILSSLPKTHREHLYMFIVHYDQLHGVGSKTWRSNPFKGKTFEGGKGVKYNWVHLPPKLQKIFTRYIETISTEE